MKMSFNALFYFYLLICLLNDLKCQTSPEDIKFTRQGVQRMIFDEKQSITMAQLDPKSIIGMATMHPQKHYLTEQAIIEVVQDKLTVKSHGESKTNVWFGGFNPFVSYTIDLASSIGRGAIGYEFSDSERNERVIVKILFKNNLIEGVQFDLIKKDIPVIQEKIGLSLNDQQSIKGKIILQMLGGGFTLFHQNKGIPMVIGQFDFNKHIDLRKKKYLHSFQSHLYVALDQGAVHVNDINMAVNTGIGMADIRAITFEDGTPFLENGRLWYTLSIRGRALPHHIQGVFSLNPTVFDLKLEGIIVFDRGDGLLRNEIASHLFFDRNEKLWRGLTTGFSAFANPIKEKKQLLAIESKTDPRFGFSVMKATPFLMVGDIEDPHLLFDRSANKWRMITCENINGYKAVVLESDHWNKAFKRIGGPVAHNSTGTSIQKIGGKRYCFSGSSARKIFIYSYPDLKELGTLNMDLPPWDKTSGTRVWPNIVQLPEGYPMRYVALMMDRYQYPYLVGKHWSYGAVYLYHGHN
ncbi:MAG: hypothetical protein CMC93_00020 [Flavobacteriaceae bacterium]|nr:hypothetical protein [Flavobacteriaceae bacterium]